ncbi:MAG: metallopeptidase TldD-related protein [Phycisphaerae bacterium]|nr:metallopeptidase TldD-related protein [Phycisphaerae bacterium]
MSHARGQRDVESLPGTMRFLRTISVRALMAVLACTALLSRPISAAPPTGDALPDGEVLMKACADELARSMTIRMEDLPRPYFVQFIVDDRLIYRVMAEFGAVESSDRSRARVLYVDVRVGDYAFDDTNFAGDGGGGGFGRRGGGGGGRGAGRGATVNLPIEDDAVAIRQAIWSAVDDEYKQSVETLGRKRAYMKDKNLTDLPANLSKETVNVSSEPPAAMTIDRAAMERLAQELSARFKGRPQILESSATVLAGLSNTYVLNSEGTRVRKGDTGAIVTVRAEGQSGDGMRLSDSRTWFARTPAELPPMDVLGAEVDRLAERLTAAMNAPILESYSGPVLFEGRAAAQLFRALLAGGLAGRVDPLGTQRRAMSGAEGLERQLGQLILPKTMQVYDDPAQNRFGDAPLAGHYRFDDEGMAARRVDLVVNGVFKDMCMSRTPTKKLSGSNGHGRQAGGGAPRAAIGCLFIEDSQGVPDAELKERLIAAAKEAGLDFGIRISALRGGGPGDAMAMLRAMMARGGAGGGRGRGGSRLGDPVVAYKVFVEDGREEPVRGCEFGDVEVRALKKIIAAGKTPVVSNFVEGDSAAASIIAPAVLIEELELSAIEQENENRPILKAPGAREGDSPS